MPGRRKKSRVQRTPPASGRSLRDTFVRNNGCTAQNPPEPANGSLTPTGTQQIVGSQSGRCAEVAGSSTANGTQVQLWDCTGATNQRWANTSGKQLQVYGNKCLDASGRGTTNGTAVIIWDCNGGTNQQWNVNSNGTITGVQSGLCLDVSGASTANGAKLNLWACHGGTNQQWALN